MCHVLIARWSYRWRLGSLLLYACSMCDVNCSSAITSHCLLVAVVHFIDLKNIIVNIIIIIIVVVVVAVVVIIIIFFFSFAGVTLGEQLSR